MVVFVATPIGNLKDITLRALEELRAADAVFCEDTRRTMQLLNAYDIKKPLYACHKYNEREAAARILSLSREGRRVCVVSDAGMPVISDPGNAVCAALKEAGEGYTVVPGANAALCALILSGLPAQRFTFVGFLPEKKAERRALLQQYASARETLLFHCAPQDADEYTCSRRSASAAPAPSARSPNCTRRASPFCSPKVSRGRSAGSTSSSSRARGNARTP